MKPRVYTASKLKYVNLWKQMRQAFPEIDFTSRWIDIVSGEDQEAGTTERQRFARAWIVDFEDVRKSDFLILYADDEEHLRGDLVEAGAAIAFGCKVIVIDKHEDYGTWQNHPQVYHEPTILSAFKNIENGGFE